MSSLVTRFAPTPNGHLHVGNFYNLIWVALLAHRNHAKIGLRIDDYDQVRYRSHFVDDIFRVLDFAKIEWHQGPTSTQDFEAHHSSRYRNQWYLEAISKIKSSDRVFWCTCTRKMESQGIYSGRCRHLKLQESSSENGLPAQLRFGLESDFLKSQMGDFIVVPRAGELSYQLASVVDDVHFGYNFLIRGEDLRPSSEAQLEMCTHLGMPTFLNTKFFHHPIITDTDGSKLSKSQSSPAVLEMLKAKDGLAELLTAFAKINLEWKGEGLVAHTIAEFCERFK